MIKKSEESKRLLRKKLNNDITNILLLFEKVQEWADLSNILQKLYLTIEKYELFVDVSSKFLLFRRLSQCLNPLLPSGVHSKALIIYSSIFKKVEMDFFINNIHILCSGIFEFMLHCTINLKTIYFKNIKSILRLKENVYIFAYALLLSLFNVVDSDNNILLYIYSINNYIGENIFFNNIWLLLLRHPEIRTNILNFLEASFSPQIYLLSKERIKMLLPYKDHLVLSSIIYCLNDKNILNQRITLSLLINNFPLSHVPNKKNKKKIIDKSKSNDYHMDKPPYSPFNASTSSVILNNSNMDSMNDNRINENNINNNDNKRHNIQINNDYLFGDMMNKQNDTTIMQSNKMLNRHNIIGEQHLDDDLLSSIHDDNSEKKNNNNFMLLNENNKISTSKEHLDNMHNRGIKSH